MWKLFAIFCRSVPAAWTCLSMKGGRVKWLATLFHFSTNYSFDSQFLRDRYCMTILTLFKVFTFWSLHQNQKSKQHEENLKALLGENPSSPNLRLKMLLTCCLLYAYTILEYTRAKCEMQFCEINDKCEVEPQILLILY